MSNGWIRLHRKFLEWEWYHDSTMVHLFLHLLIKCNHKDKKWQGVLIKRGQCITSYSNLSQELGMTYKQIRTRLEKLEKTGELGRQTGSQFTLITISNYDSYQMKDKKEGSQVGNSRAVGGQSEGNKQEGKEYKECKEVEEYDSEILKKYIRAMAEDDEWNKLIRHRFPKLSEGNNTAAALNHFLFHCEYGKRTHDDEDDCRDHFKNWMAVTNTSQIPGFQ